MKIELLKTKILHIRKYPKMYFPVLDNRLLISYLFGYLSCHDEAYSSELNKDFSVWLNSKGNTSAIFWTVLIEEINKDEASNFENTLDLFDSFLKTIES